jgi:hypothetical protein
LCYFPIIRSLAFLSLFLSLLALFLSDTFSSLQYILPDCLVSMSFSVCLCSLSLCQTVFLSVYLLHTHTHTLSLSLCVSVNPCLSVSAFIFSVYNYLLVPLFNCHVILFMFLFFSQCLCLGTIIVFLTFLSFR